MANPGNRGKRYVFRHIARAEVSERGGISFWLDCGHAMPTYEPHNPPRPWDYIWTPEHAQTKVGERQACFECGKARSIGGGVGR